MSIEFVVNNSTKPTALITFGKGSVMMTPCSDTGEGCGQQFLLALSPVSEGEVGLVEDTAREVPDFYKPHTLLTKYDPHYPVQIQFDNREALEGVISMLSTMLETWPEPEEEAGCSRCADTGMVPDGELGDEKPCPACMLKKERQVESTD